MNAIGLCPHNNLANYCPTCSRQDAYNRRATMNGGGMGTTCQPGYYNLKVLGIDTGQCLPSLSTATTAVESGLTSSVATGAATSSANIAAAKQAGITAAANNLVAYVKAHPIIVASVLGSVGLLAFYGFGKLSFGRS